MAEVWPPLEIPMLDSYDWNRLDAAAFRVSIRRSVRRLAWLLAGVGVLVGVLGLAAPFVPLVAIGLVLASAGIWNLRRPSTTGLIVDGVAVILAGIFSSLAGLWIEGGRASSLAKGIIGGSFQIVWGIRRLALYRTARFAPNDPQAIARLEALIQDLSKSKAKTDPTVAEFRTGRFHTHRNRLGLYDEGAIALLEHQAVRLERRADISIRALGTISLGRSIKVEIRMSDLRLTGQMPTEQFERFERWKVGRSEPRAVAA